MKSRWLKKAMAAFLAVLMTVCALPVAAFVPETVETGEEFEPSISATSGVSNGGKSVDYGDLTYTINANGEVECVNYFNNSKRLTNIKNAELLCVIDDFLLVLRTQNSITEIMTYSISEEKEIDVYQIENKIEAISTRGKCIYYLSDHSIFEYDILTQTKNCIYRNSEMTSFVLSDFYTIAVYIDSDLSKLSSQEYILISIENNEDVSKTKLQAEDSSYSVSIGGNIIPFSDYPNGSYFTDNGQPCAVGAHKEENQNCYMSESYCNCKCTYNGVWLKSSQCMGFASMTFLRLYGHTIYDQCYKSVSTIAIGSVTKNRVQSLISDGSIKPGAHIRTINGHSLIYMGSDSQYFYTYEGNTDNRCRVSVIRNTWDSAIGYYNKNGISYVQLPNNYPDTGTLPDPTATTTSSSTGHKYAVYNYATTWENAKAKCEELGGYLATITSDSEQSLVLSLVQNLNKPCWIGAYRDSGSSAYKWITGESFSYTNWDDDEPSMSNGGRDERFVGIYANDTDTQYSTTGKWNDFSETTGTIKGFVCEWNPQTYTVSYNANGGTGAPGNQNKIHGVSLTLSSVKPTKDGYTFQGWSTSSTGGVQYNPGSAYTGNANLTLYAVWSIKTYTISYNANGGTGAPASQTKVHGQNLTLSNMRPTKDGYTFQGWSTILYGTVAYQPGGQFDENRNLTLHAVWSQKTYTVSYDANGGTGAPASQTKTHGKALTLSGLRPVRDGYSFQGWATSPDGPITYGAGYVYAEEHDQVFYAIWNEGEISWKIEDDTLIISGSGNMENYSANSPAPWESATFSKVIIENGVTSIGEESFIRSKYLANVMIPESVISIGRAAFYACKNLCTVKIPYGVKEIQANAFRYCSSLNNVVIQDSVTQIGNCAFHDCDALTIANYSGLKEQWEQIETDSSIYPIANVLSYGCGENLVWRIQGDTLYIRGEGKMKNYSHHDAPWVGASITKAVIEYGVTSIGDRAFSAFLLNLTSVSISSSVTSIGDEAFCGTKLTSVSIPSGVTSIGDYAFCGTELTSVSIPSSVTSIGQGVFQRCYSLISVTIPGNVTSIGKNAFYGCSSLSDIYYDSSRSDWDSINIAEGNSWLTNATLHTIEPVTSITLNKTSATLKKGETLTLTATVAPSDAANKSVTWSSGNTSVATVSTSGVVTAVGEGTAVITVTTADGGKTATCTVAVAHTHNYTGTYYETAHPHKAYSTCSCGEINYTGATQKVASCASCYPVTGVTLDKTTATLKKGETLALAVTVSPSDAANKAFTVTSSNPSVMSAEYRISVCVGDLFDGSTCTASHCEFTALSAGSTTLTFTTEDGQKTATCTVTVTEPVVNAKAKFTLSEASGRPGDTVKITLSLKTEETINSIAISGITYDKSIMTFTGFSDYEHIEDLTILPPTFDEEKMAIVIGLKNAAAFDGDICTLNFKINENALEGVTNIDASSVVKLKSAEIPSAVASGKVNVRLQTLGDIDGNDTVDIDDAVLLFQYSMLPELYPISYAGNLDFNKDGTVDIDDAVRLFQYSMLPDLYPLE